MNNLNIYNFIQIFNIFLLLSLFNLNKGIDNNMMILPNSLILSDNSQVVVVNDGIHFLDYNLENEETDRYIPLTFTKGDLSNLVMTQFQREYGGYIIIYVQETIFIFESNEKINIKTQNISNTISGEYYNIVPYKKSNNIIIFFITYKEKPSFIIANCRFDVSDHSSNIIITKKLFLYQLNQEVMRKIYLVCHVCL